MILDTYFKDFLSNINLTKNQISRIKNAHETLRNRLKNDEELSKYIIDTFLQGSYKRATAIRPKNGEKSDVDIVVVLNLNKDEIEPNKIFNLFENFLEKYYEDYEFNNKSIRITLSDVDIDLVITLLDDFSTSFSKNFFNKNVITLMNENFNPKDYKKGYLYLPNTQENKWIKINPTAQIICTTSKNKKTNGIYIKVVKAIKWWQRLNYPDSHIKSYPLERLIFECCPNEIRNIGEGVLLTFKNMIKYEQKPYLKDFALETDVLENISYFEYSKFFSRAYEASEISKQAYLEEDGDESIKLWKELFGNKFDNSDTTKNSGFTKPNKKADVPSGRFA
ncbi:MAG: nucleotidyltransferase [Methanobrevibacter ruminantium]|uniref:SMODS domain-containing nucleotidyltransferase n=1 Tax=Methanobrevibacter ruminantium TaxID=83816 RepID=UPI0026ECA098|nr:nucleotidyltransferase [Methanobrevibacter ruminantium]MDO5841972.1 nucleotidyltransferase [Methanobrevibacter ruminantium]